MNGERRTSNVQVPDELGDKLLYNVSLTACVDVNDQWEVERSSRMAPLSQRGSRLTIDHATSG